MTSTNQRTRVICIALFVFSTLTAYADNSATIAERLQPNIERAMADGRIPSLTIALVAGDEVVYSEGFGHSNVWAQTPARPETVYLIGSTFKTMSTTALLQLAEKGKLNLDDPVNDYLKAFKIEGGDAEHPVTFRHLLTHTSGLPSGFSAHPVWGDTAPLPLEKYLTEVLRVERKPLATVEYSNPAFTLVAYIIEQVSEMPYKQYMQRNIFDPLEMKDIAFNPRPDMDERMAVPYLYDDKTKKHTPALRNKADVWPAGIVYGTVLTQANWLIMNLNGGVYKGKRIINEATLNEAMSPQFPDVVKGLGHPWLSANDTYGLAWWLGERNGEHYFAHSGSVNGFTSFIVGNRERRLGCAILTNGNRSHQHLIKLSNQAIDLMAELGLGEATASQP